MDSDGDFRVISANVRSAINDEDEKARLGNDTDYLKQMHMPQGEYTPGVFYGCISKHNQNNFIVCRDFDKPYIYKVNS